MNLKKYVKIFKLNIDNNCNYIDFNEAKEKKLKTFFLWVSKDGL